MISRILIILYLLLLIIGVNGAAASEKRLTLVFAGSIPNIGIQTYGTFTGLAGLLEKMRAKTPLQYLPLLEEV